MTRRIVLSVLLLIAAVIGAVAVPLGLLTASQDRHDFTDETTATASTLANVAEAYVSIESENLDREIALEACLRLLKERARNVLAMRFEQGLQTGAIATAMGVAPNAIRVMLHRVRNQLAECINRRLASRGGMA